jgi:hypothetical protein
MNTNTTLLALLYIHPLGKGVSKEELDRQARELRDDVRKSLRFQRGKARDIVLEDWANHLCESVQEGGLVDVRANPSKPLIEEVREELKKLIEI